MKALLYDTFQGPLSVTELPDPEPGPQGVVVKVKVTGLCRSDWHGWMGHDPDMRLPHVPGHELAGIVAAVGNEVQKFKIGDRVTVPFVCACGVCPQCDSGNQQVCDNQSQPGFTHWGSFAEYVALDHADINLVKLPDWIDDQTSALLGCRFVTSYRAVVDQGSVDAGQYVAVHGCGGVGLSAIMIARAKGARVIAIDINKGALALAQTLGAEHGIVASGKPDLIEEIRAYSHGGVHLSIDALGSPETCYNSIAGLRKRGRHIQVGLMAGDHKQARIPMERVIADELEIRGSHGIQAFKYPEVFELIRRAKLDFKPLVYKSISLGEAADILPLMDTLGHAGVYLIENIG